MKLQQSICLTTALLFLAVTGPTVSAEEPTANLTGTWKVTYIDSGKGQTNNSGKSQTFQPTLKLKLEGDKLTGTLTRRRGQQDIKMVLQDAKLKASEISFTVILHTESGKGQNAVKKFHGKITGDMIQGTVETKWAGESFTRDWEAKRVKE
ncbi:MAG: hypothetical protein ABSE97_09855 [Verrucomicrobiota bacterium]|jgi:hypothetical protein